MSTWCRSTVNQRIVNTTRRLLGTKTFIVRLTNDSDSFEISPVEKGFIADEPGHMLTNSITKLTSRYAFSISICNHTNKTILFRRGCVVGKSSPLSSEEISDVFTHLLQILSSYNIDLSELQCKPDFKQQITSIILHNAENFREI